MNIALIGYGKMGKAIEKIAEDRGHHIVKKFHSKNLPDSESLEEADVAIEFTTPDSVIENINLCLENKVPVVVGSTGWYQKLDTVEQACIKLNGALLYASNFSLGVNLFFKLNIELAKMLNQYPDYEPQISEIHHTEKIDSPSGTAITIANDILNNYTHKKDWLNEKTNDDQYLHIESVREKGIPGTHIVSYSSKTDQIEIKHTAKSRTGFALGAVVAAEFLHDKKGVYTMQDALNL